MIKSLIAAILIFSPLLASETVAFIKNIQGDATLQRKSDRIPLQKGMALVQNDLLRTGENGTVALSFNDGTMIAIGPKSILVIDEYLFAPAQKQYRLNVSLEKGSAAFESGKLGKLAPETVKFKVPQGIVGIKGTKFVVEVE
jgi:hypothetical protein